MTRIPSKEKVEGLRKSYPIGTRVQLVQMVDPYTKLKPGALGTIDFIDDTGTIFVNWDLGSSLGVVYGVDRLKKIK